MGISLHRSHITCLQAPHGIPPLFVATAIPINFLYPSAIARNNAILSAGTAPSGTIGEVSDDLLRKSFEVNFFSHQNCASEAVKIMRKQNIHQ